MITFKDFIGYSYVWFSTRQCTPETLQSFVEQFSNSFVAWDKTRGEVYSELERLHTVEVIDTTGILEDNTNHVEWFNPSANTGTSRQIEWHFWDHFKQYMTIVKHWPVNVVDSVDRNGSEILSRLEDPQRLDLWDRRGMVVGSVQSGKTANYMGLICKAIDAGYKLIVVMAGVHNSLRSQTQYRLNEEILGYDLEKVQKYSDQASIGVRAMFNDHRIIQTLTSSNEKGDFKKSIANQAGMIPHAESDPIVMVVKKNVSILKNLREWATSIVNTRDDTGRIIVTGVPLLLIDDECDYASVNTRKVTRDENGMILADYDPAATNKRIREMLQSFQKSAYVGYTATPFANIFIHKEGRHPTYGEDLFPRNFIVSLPRPTNYIGPARVFGMDANPAAGLEQQEPLPLRVEITDSDEIIPSRHKKDLPVDRLPESLERAIKSFLLACAARRLRSALPVHNSMLVHVTRFTNVQAQVHSLTEKELERCCGRIQNNNDELAEFKALWEEDFGPASAEMRHDFASPHHTWEEIRENLYPVASRVKVQLVNGLSKESLQYREAELDTTRRVGLGENVPWEQRGVHVIAIGGDKLSRGLTLDGLTVSYYLRASRMYDTLMQMGRWFGYKDGYEDLCRIYTTRELMDWYSHIAAASEELRNELEYMALIGETPERFGLKVQSHPGQLAITSAGKRRNTETLKLSYSGECPQTVVFDPNKSKENIAALVTLIGSAQAEGEQNDTSIPNLHWSEVSPAPVIQFLDTYQTHETAARVVSPQHMARFIGTQLEMGTDDLTTWDVVIISREPAEKILEIEGYEIGCSKRTATISEDLISIGALRDPRDEWIDYSDDEKEALRNRWAEATTNDVTSNSVPPAHMIRGERPKQRGVLFIYPVLIRKKMANAYGVNGQPTVIGIAVSFPGSDTTVQVEYVVNSVFQDAES